MADEYDIPEDLIAVQRAFWAAEQRVAEAARSEDPQARDTFKAAFKEQQDAALAIHRHRWWSTVDNRHEADTALKRAARKVQ